MISKQTFNNPAIPDSLYVACRRFEKLVLPSVFDTNLSFLMM